MDGANSSCIVLVNRDGDSERKVSVVRGKLFTKAEGRKKGRSI